MTKRDRQPEIGDIDILVNNAGIIKRAPILDMPLAEFEQVIAADLVAPFIVGKRVAPKMIEKRAGKIINMCCEWAKYNVRANGIGPGYIATAQTAPIRVGGHPFNDLVMTCTPADRWGEPDDVGNAALFLASRAADFVNGHVHYVDGGITANFGYVKGENVVWIQQQLASSPNQAPSSRPSNTRGAIFSSIT